MIIYNTKLVRILSFGFARGITIFPFIFVNDNEQGNEVLLNHERIHIRQQVELLFVGFVLLYFFSFLVNYLKYKNFDNAYRNIFFEQEAYSNQTRLDYLDNRKIFSHMKYMKNHVS